MNMLTAAFPSIAARRNHAQSVDSAPRARENFQEAFLPPAAVAARSAAGGTIGVRTTLQCVPFLAMCWTACKKKSTFEGGPRGILTAMVVVAAVLVQEKEPLAQPLKQQLTSRDR